VASRGHGVFKGVRKRRKTPRGWRRGEEVDIRKFRQTVVDVKWGI